MTERYIFSRILRRYKKKDGPNWTLTALLKHICKELEPVGAVLEKSTLSFAGSPLRIDFIRNNFPPYKNTVEVNGSLYVEREGQPFVMVDMFSLGKDYYGRGHRSLQIYKDQQWRDSHMQKEVIEFYLPLLQQIVRFSPEDLLHTGFVTVSRKRVALVSLGRQPTGLDE